MARPPIDILTETIEPAKPRSLARPITLAALGLILVPLVWEEGQLCVARWCEAFDKDFKPSTPILDFLGRAFAEGQDKVWDSASPMLAVMSWRPDFVFPFLLLIIVIAAWLLKR
jgi:hypothetical protein